MGKFPTKGIAKFQLVMLSISQQEQLNDFGRLILRIQSSIHRNNNYQVHISYEITQEACSEKTWVPGILQFNESTHGLMKS